MDYDALIEEIYTEVVNHIDHGGFISRGFDVKPTIEDFKQDERYMAVRMMLSDVYATGLKDGKEIASWTKKS